MKKIYTTFLILALAINLIAQTPTIKWQGASSNDWDYISANWVPVDGLPFPASFVESDDVMLDDSRTEGKDSIVVIGEIKAANVTFSNTSATTPYNLYAADTTSKIIGDGAIYKEGDGVAIVGVNTDMLGGLVARDGIYTANNPDGSINAFGSKVTFEGGSINIHHTAVDNPTFITPSNIEIAEGNTGSIITTRRVNLTGKALGSGTLNFISNGERDIIDLTNGADWTGFTGQVNVIKGDAETTYTSGFYGLVLQTDSTYSIVVDDTLGTGNITETGVNNMLATTKIHLESGTTMGAWSGNRCFQLGELTGDEDVIIMGYVKKSTTPNIFYRVGSSNTDFTLASKFTGDQGTGADLRRYNYVGLVKVGNGAMRLTNPDNYITGLIVVKEGKLFVSNPEGSSTGTGVYNPGTPLIVGPGAVLGGTGIVSRNVDVYGTIEPGEDAVGTLTLRDSLGAVGTADQTMFSVNIKKVGAYTAELASASEYDVLVSDSFVIEGGTLNILPAASYDLKAGETYKILDGGFKIESVEFDEIVLPFTDDGWEWDTSNLYVDGSISLSAGGGSGTYGTTEPTDTTGTTEPTDTTGTTEPTDTTGVGFDQYSFEDIQIYPNPNNGQFTLNLSKVNASAIKIYNASGVKVFEQEIKTNTINVTLDNALSNGLHLIQVKTPQGIISRKMLVQK